MLPESPVHGTDRTVINETVLTKRIEPNLVIIDQNMRFFNLLRRHFLDHLFLAYSRVWITADGGKNVPHVSPDQVWFGHTTPYFLIPTHPGLSARVSLHGRTQVPFKSSNVITFNSESHRIHDSDQFLGLGVPGAGSGKQFLHRLLETISLHKVTSLFEIRVSRQCNTTKKRHEMTAHYLFHHSFFFGLLRMLPMLFIMNLIAPDSMLSAAHLKVMKKVNEKDYSHQAEQR
jgi:cytochrome c peroxidase